MEKDPNDAFHQRMTGGGANDLDGEAPDHTTPESQGETQQQLMFPSALQRDLSSDGKLTMASASHPSLDIRPVAQCDPNVFQMLAEWHHTQFGGRTVETRVAELWKIKSSSIAECHSLTSAVLPEAIPNCLIAFTDGAVAGSVRLVADDFDGLRPQYWPWLGTLCVHPEKRGTGIGTRLVQECQAAAAEAGSSTIFLWAANDMAEKLYSRLGWTVVERTSPPHDIPGKKVGIDLIAIMKSPSTHIR